MAQLQTVHVLSLDDYLPGEDSSESRKIDVVSNSSTPGPIRSPSPASVRLETKGAVRSSSP